MKAQLKTTQQEISFNAGAQAIAEDLASEFLHQRRSRGWSQNDAAKLMGCADSSVSNLENVAVLSGQKSGFPSMELVRRACAAYGVSEGRTLERFRHLRKLAGLPGEMRNKGGIGCKRVRRAPWVPQEPMRIVDEFDFPFDKPGLSKDLLCMLAVWVAILIVAGLQLFYFIK